MPRQAKATIEELRAAVDDRAISRATFNLAARLLGSDGQKRLAGLIRKRSRLREWAGSFKARPADVRHIAQGGVLKFAERQIDIEEILSDAKGVKTNP